MAFTAALALVLVVSAPPPAPAAGKPAPTALPSVALFSIEARGDVKAAIAEVLTDLAVDELRATRQFSRVVSQREIETVMGVERQRQLLDCTDSSCLAEIAGSLGVDLVMSGAMAKLGSAWVLQLRLLRTKDGTAASSLSARACANSEDNAVALVAPAVRKLVADAGMKGFDVPRMPPPDCASSPLEAATRVPGAPVPGALVTPEKAPDVNVAPEEQGSGSPLPKVLKGAGGLFVALGGAGVPLVVLLVAGGAALLGAMYAVPDLRALPGQGQNNFWLAHVPSVAMWGAGGVVVLVGVLTTLLGAVMLVAGVVL